MGAIYSTQSPQIADYEKALLYQDNCKNKSYNAINAHYQFYGNLYLFQCVNITSYTSLGPVDALLNYGFAATWTTDLPGIQVGDIYGKIEDDPNPKWYYILP